MLGMIQMFVSIAEKVIDIIIKVKEKFFQREKIPENDKYKLETVQRITHDTDFRTNSLTCIPCASCDFELVAKLHNEDRLEFDFQPDKWAQSPPDFISLIYQYKKPIALKKLRKLSFDILFMQDNLCQIDLEIKAYDNKMELKKWLQEIYRKEGWVHYKFDLTSEEVRDKINNIKEICFVVRPRYIEKGQHPSGEFWIKDLRIE